MSAGCRKGTVSGRLTQKNVRGENPGQKKLGDLARENEVVRSGENRGGGFCVDLDLGPTALRETLPQTEELG